MTPDERAAFNEDVAEQALRGRLDLRRRGRRSTAARACRPWRAWCSPRSSPGPRRRCAPTSSATRSSARRSCSGAPRSRSRSSCRKILNGRDARGARASASPTPAPTSPSLKTTAVLDGDEWVINGQKVWTTAGPVRRLLLPARPHRSRRRRSTRASPTCSCRCSSRASRCAASPSPTAPPSSTRCSSTDARCPKDNVVGGVNNGWKVANTTLALRAGHVGHHRLPPLRGGARR